MSSSNGISFLYEFDLGNRNVLNPGQNIISVTSTAPGDFDKSNLFTDSTLHRWRSVDVSGWQEIVIQADLVTDIDTFGILGHNLTEDAVIQLQANISNNFLAPPITVTIPWREDYILWLDALGDSYEFYKLRILDPTNPCGFIELGRIVGGQAFTMGDCEGISDDFSISSKDFAEQMKTQGYFRHSNERVKARTLGASTSKVDSKTGNNTNFQGLRELFDTVGISIPLLLIADRTDPELFMSWGQFRDIPTENFTTNRFVTMRMSFEEVF
jgi:hypothetical protein